MWKIQESHTEESVCKLIGKTHKTIRLWRRQYEKGGLPELLNIKVGRGRKALMSDPENIRKDIELLQVERNGGRVKCQDIKDFLEKKYGIKYSQSGIYNALKRLGFSWVTVRSRHPKQDLQAQEKFKKNSLKK